ncbi:DUF1232 domain-containing protein [Streptomyces sp. NPDC091272]|uniref:DUF1232 domain-containing protein n=1 Tax=Streptomyces sp. NPDC091272 TaxID=3365981 RepID=UPI0038148D4D
MSDGTVVLLVLAGLAVVAMVVVAVMLLVKMVKARKLLNEAGIPVENKFLFWGAVVYLLSPVDLLPDPLLLDDIGVMLIALRSLYAAAEKAGVTRGRGREPDRVPVIDPAGNPVRRRDRSWADKAPTADPSRAYRR